MLTLRRWLRLGLPLGVAGTFLALWLVCIQSMTVAIARANHRGHLTWNHLNSISIHDIQGASHKSPLENQMVAGVKGVVTALRKRGFYMQEPAPDSDEATSEGIYVHLNTKPVVQVGDMVSITGTVVEETPFSLSPGSLSVTWISATISNIQVLSTGLELPEPVLVGQGGRAPPDQIIEDDSDDDVNDSGFFDPATDGIDFYESLEGMRVKVLDPVAVSGTSQDGVIVVLGDGGELAGVRTPRGGLVVQPDDFNPERILVEDAIITSEPRVSVGASFSGVITGVLDYSLGNFKLFNTEPFPSITTTGVTSETVSEASPDQLSVVTLNTKNLDPKESPSKYARLARQIVGYLLSPDILVLEEIQDSNGSLNDAVVTATLTYSMLVTAIQEAGGPLYQVRQIDPLDDQDGGQLGGNIRVGFVFRTDRGLSFVDRPGGDAITPVTATLGTNESQISISPGRVDPLNQAFNESRKPLAGEFIFKGHKLILIACHLNSRSDDSLLFGRYQPPRQYSQAQRIQQAGAVNAFVHHILTLDPLANVIVLGDFNDFPFSTSLAALQGEILTNVLYQIPEAERYTYIFEGNSQALDHILVSDNLLQTSLDEVDIVHLNAEFAEATRPTDHDPVMVRFSFEEIRHAIYLPILSRATPPE